ncbi:MAG: Ig-like domain-containing protein, partial [Eubacterium ventriosum]
CEVSSITSAGYKLSQFADTTDTYGALVYEALTKNTWDYVVVQENRAVLVEKEYKAESAVNTLHSLIKKAGAKMIIYATQPNNIGSTFSVNSTSFYLTDLQIEQILTRNNFKIANNYEGLVAASGTNFMRVMADYPDITLYRTDNLHPTVAGSYLAACTIYYRMFNKSPYGNKFLPGSEYDTDKLISKLAMDDALILQQIADGRLLINTHYTTINKGQSSKLTATFTANAKNETLTDYKNNIIWDSTDLAGVSVNKLTGEFTALKTGKYQVMATTDSGLICYSTIDVKQPATSLTIKEDKILKVVKGYSGHYTTEMGPSDTTDKITWESDLPSVVSVNSNGNITAKKVGIAKITATTTSGIKVVHYVRVKLKTPTGVKLTKKSKKITKKKKSYSVTVKWTKNTNAVKYYVYRRLSTKSSYTRIATTIKPKYIDTKVKKNKKYYYKIKAIYSNTKLNSDKTPAYAIEIGK